MEAQKVVRASFKEAVILSQNPGLPLSPKLRAGQADMSSSDPNFSTTQPMLPDPKEGLLVTHLLIVRDQERAKHFYQHVIGAVVVQESDPVILQLGNSWLVINVGGGPTADKPVVTAAAPEPSAPLSSALNLRVSDIQATYNLWKSRGANFMTEPKELGTEIRCYLTDPDGHYIELGQRTART